MSRLKNYIAEVYGDDYLETLNERRCENERLVP